jgi:hypothetical protein
MRRLASRRDVLQGLGLGWLPLLQATRSYGASPLAPKRFVCVLQPFGYRMNSWLPGLLAKLLGMMKAGPAGATLLEQSVVLWATTMKDGADRNIQSVPWLLAGQCGGYFKTGQVADSAGKPLHGVLAEICSAMGTPVEFFGDRAFGTPIGGLRA